MRKSMTRMLRLTVILLVASLCFNAAQAQVKSKTERPTRQETPQKKPTKTIVQPQINTTIKPKTLVVAPPVLTPLEKAYRWLAPFKSYHLMTAETMEYGLKSLDLSTGGPLVNGAPMGQYMADDSLVHLLAFKGLEILTVPRLMTNHGLDYIGQMTSLNKLYLSNSKINDNAFPKIAQLPLTTLILFETAITGAGLAQAVQDHPGLEILNIGSTSLTDNDLAALNNLSQLRVLILSRGNFTDAALPYLLNHTNLDFLSIEFTQISSAGKQTLHNAMPNTTIID